MAGSLRIGERLLSGPGRFRFAVPAPAGGVGIGEVARHTATSAADVFFTVGRCFFVVWDYVPHSRSAGPSERIALAGARALAVRAAPACG
jgi:hypothetical protein